MRLYTLALSLTAAILCTPTYAERCTEEDMRPLAESAVEEGVRYVFFGETHYDQIMKDAILETARALQQEGKVVGVYLEALQKDADLTDWEHCTRTSNNIRFNRQSYKALVDGLQELEVPIHGIDTQEYTSPPERTQEMGANVLEGDEDVKLVLAGIHHIWFANTPRQTQQGTTFGPFLMRTTLKNPGDLVEEFSDGYLTVTSPRYVRTCTVRDMRHTPDEQQSHFIISG